MSGKPGVGVIVLDGVYIEPFTYTVQPLFLICVRYVFSVAVGVELPSPMSIFFQIAACLSAPFVKIVTFLIVSAIFLRELVLSVFFAYLLGIVFKMGIFGVYLGAIIGMILGCFIGFSCIKIYERKFKKECENKS